MVLALGDDRLRELSVANWALIWESTVILLTVAPDLVITFLSAIVAVIRLTVGTSLSFPDKLDLLPLERLVIFLVKLMAALVVASVVDENARVAKAAVSMLVVVFAPLRIVIYSCSHLHEIGRLLRTFQRARELLLPKIVFSLDEVVRVAVLASVHFRIELTFSDLPRDFLVLFSVVQPIFFLFFAQVLFGLLLVYFHYDFSL